MDNREIVRQMIDFHKRSFENCFSMMMTVQEQAEKLLKTFVDKTPGLSDESKKVLNQWSGAYKKGINDLKKAMDEGCARVDAFFKNNASFIFQDQAEKMFNSYLNQANWMPQDLNKTMTDFSATYQKSCDDFKKYVDENIWRMANFSAVTQKPQKKTSKRK
jgi:gas vesicle protein